MITLDFLLIPLILFKINSTSTVTIESDHKMNIPKWKAVILEIPKNPIFPIIDNH